MKLNFNEETADALHDKKPIVALESTVIAHGLPFPENLETAFTEMVLNLNALSEQLDIAEKMAQGFCMPDKPDVKT